jgi:putative ABC transport system permease protein
VKFLRFILRSLFRSKRRTLLTVLSITLSVMLIAILQSILVTLDGFANNPEASNRIVVRHKVSITSMLPLRYADWLRQQPEVESVMGLQWFQGVYIDRKNFFPNFASELDCFPKVFKEEVVDYSATEFRDLLRDRNGCICGQALADKFGWKVGDVVPLESDIFPVKLRLNLRCIYHSKRPSSEMNLHFHYKLFEESVWFMKGRVGTFFVRARHPDDVPRLIERIDRHFRDDIDPTMSETENAFQLVFLKMMGNYAAMIQAITGAVLAAILIVTANTMGMAIRERTTEIAVLRAMGFRSGLILSLLLGEGILLSLLGGAAGLGLAQLAAGAIRNVAGTFLPYLQDFSIAPSTLTLCLGATFGVGLLATFIPAYKATGRPIVDGLRSL